MIGERKRAAKKALRLTSRAAVLEAIEEFDQLGRAEFLALYGFGKEQGYRLIHAGRSYDSKAIAGVAFGKEHGRPLKAHEFSGGKQAAALWLHRLKFTVTGMMTTTGTEPARGGCSRYGGRRKVPKRTGDGATWTDPELFDRANQAHEDTVAAFADYLVLRGLDVWRCDGGDPRADLTASCDGLALVVEAKSLPAGGEASQLRLGLGQVLWYRHRCKSAWQEDRVAVLVVEREPPSADAWIELCGSVDVFLTWPGRFDELWAAFGGTV